MVLCLIGASFLPFDLPAQSSRLGFTEISQIQAAYLRHIAEYARWPESVEIENRGIVIGVVGRDSQKIAGILEYSVKSDIMVKVKGHAPVIRKFADANADGLDECDLLYILGSEGARIAQLLEALKGKPILTASEIAGFTKQGGMIGLELTSGSKSRIVIVVNLQAAAQSSIQFSSKLLGLKKGVRIEGE